jgi:hypothetical protein
MRVLATVAVVLMLALAGCNAGFQPSGEETSTPAPETTETSTDSAADGGTPTTDETAAATTGFDFADPASDRLGWEAGYWYNESVPVTAEDGLNESELDALVARSMARVEQVRELEFEETVPVTVINRSTYREQYAGESDYTDEFVTFDNAKFEALFLIGEDRNALSVQNANRGSNVLGFYSPANDSIVLVSSSETPTLNDEFTLAHELVHAVQDQRYNLSSYVRPTREVYNAQNGLIEGDANYVQDRYQRACEADWECLSVPSENGSSGGGDLHFGVYFLNFFPYSDGPGFVDYHYDRSGWEAVNEIYTDMPASSEHVINPELYGEPVPNVTLKDSNSGEWERVRVGPQRPGHVRPSYASFGQSGVASMFAYTMYDEYNRSRVIEPNEFLNVDEDGNVNGTDPLNYDIAYADGWSGDRLHVYDTDDETAYVWRLDWDSPEEAAEFAEGYRLLLAHWGGDRVSGSANHWAVGESPFEDAFYLEVDGGTVTIVNAPTQEDLGSVYAGYEPPSASGSNGSSASVEPVSAESASAVTAG